MPISETEKEKSRQAIIICFRCRRLFPVNIMLDHGRLTLDTGTVTYDADLGFICQSCSGPDPLGDDTPDRREPEQVKTDILDILYAERGGLSVQELSDMIGVNYNNVSYYINKLLTDQQVRRERRKGLRHDLYYLCDELDHEK